MAIKYSSYSMFQRLLALIVLVVFFACGITFRIFYLQVLNGYSYIEKGMTQQGPHRDDFEIFMNDINIKKFGSQGQMRSCVLKLKLSECDIIKEKTGEEPILLLDDILSELDVERRKFFIEKIKDKQVIITCTDKEDYFDEDCYVFKVENGKVIKEEKR